MKPFTRLFTTIALALVAISNQSAVADTNSLLKTQWYQDGPFAQFTPNHERVGCWSTAYAQILYYHRLKPTGRVTYDCTSGQKIDVNLDQFRFDWNQFVDAVSEATPKRSVEQLAQYSFATAAVVRKDFGTDRYMRLLSSVADLEAHYSLDAEIYVYVAENTPIRLEELAARTKSENVTNVVDRTQIIELLATELRAERPVYFYFGNLRSFGHASVIDGMRRDGNRYMVHINFGNVVAARNRWYDLFAPLEVHDDDILRAFVTIKPLPAQSSAKAISGDSSTVPH